MQLIDYSALQARAVHLFCSEPRSAPYTTRRSNCAFYSVARVIAKSISPEGCSILGVTYSIDDE